MLTDSPQARLPSPKRRKKTDLQHRYSDSQKMEALKLYLVTGNLSVVSAKLDIGYKTLQYWRYSQWWEELTKQIKQEGKIQLSNRLRSIADLALDAVKDRLENGEWVMSPTGDLVRKQVSLRDAHTVAKDNIQNAIQIETEPDQDQTNERIADRLSALADAFAKFASKATRVEVIDAIYDVPGKTSLEHGEEESSWESGVQPTDSTGTVVVHETGEPSKLLEKSRRCVVPIEPPGIVKRYTENKV